MGMTFLTGYILGQQGAQSARVASTAAMASGSSADQLWEIHERVDRLVLVVDAMWSLLEESGYTDEQLRDRIARIDGADGELDGRRTPRPVACRGCEAMVAAGLEACQFCGTGVSTAGSGPIASI